MAAKEIVFVDGDDWNGMYVNGQLVLQGHDLQLCDVLEQLGIEAEFKFADTAPLVEEGSLPMELNEVRFHD